MKKTILFLFVLALIFNACKKDKTSLSDPKNITASDEYALKVVLGWDDVSGADGYNIYRTDFVYDESLDPLEYEKVGTTEDNVYEDKSVISNSSYYYKIEAYAGSSTGPLSDSILGTTIVLTAEEAFVELASATGGAKYDAASASEVPDMIIEIIDDHAVTGTDLVFLIDNTGSMYDDIDEVKFALSSILSSLPSNTSVAVATYADVNVDDPWYDWMDLTTNLTTVQTFINDIAVSGGGDYPESVYDGIYETIDNLSWASSSKRIMMVIGDAPPLEGELSAYTLEDVIEKCESTGLIINLYPILISSY